MRLKVVQTSRPTRARRWVVSFDPPLRRVPFAVHGEEIAGQRGVERLGQQHAVARDELPRARDVVHGGRDVVGPGRAEDVVGAGGSEIVVHRVRQPERALDVRAAGGIAAEERRHAPCDQEVDPIELRLGPRAVARDAEPFVGREHRLRLSGP